ncbi:MAG: TIGR04133 family radical SAM/SPASM protein [Bacteroidales bacterium]|nr:TIGR04133 family radical SAM/SPASM protein [Bacteroidales bacterium]
MSSYIKWWLWRLFRSNETKVHELNYLFWECTTRCNLHCRHCGSDCKIASQDTDMPLDDFLRAIDTIPRKAIPREFTVVLTGGEPLLRPDIEEIGKAIRKRGMGWSMVSNGFFYDQKMHARLLGAGMGALTISLDGLEEEHEWMRGRKGCFAKTLQAIGIAAREPRINFDVVTCVNKKNKEQLEEIYNRLSGLGVKQWRIFTVIPIGRAADDPDMHLDPAEFKALMEFIKEKRLNAAPGSMNVTFSCEGYLGDYEMKVRQTPYMCRAGISVASVLIDGRICACPNIDRDRFSQGNIYDDNFYEVWQTRFGDFRDRRWAKVGQCKDCKVFDRCLGNGMHNWHGSCKEVLNCHYKKTL